MIRTRRLSRPFVLGCVLAVLSLGLAACGDDTDSDTPSGSSASQESDAEGDTAVDDLDPTAGVTYPENATPDAPVVELYTDFQCPACQSFTETYLSSLRDAADDGKITLVFHQFAFLDRASKNEYSSRSANAATCVYTEGGSTAYLDFYEALFDDQPAEGTAGPGDDELIDLAETVGGTDIDACVSEGAYADYVKDAAESAQEAGVNGTPTVIVDGEAVDLAELEQVFAELTA